MKKLVLLLILLYNFYISADNNTHILPVSRYQNLYQMLEQIQLESGITPGTALYPLTLNEVKKILNEVDINSPLYSLIIDELPEYRAVGLNLSSELYLGVEDLTRSETPFELEFTPALGYFYSGFVTVPVRHGIDITADDINFNSNLSIFTNYEQMDIQFPFTAINSIGGELWNISLGRDLLSYGDGSTGNFLISDDSTFHDFIRIKGLGEKFKYNLTVINIEAVDGIGNLDSSFEPGDNEREPDLDREDIQLLFSHSLEYRPIKNLRIALNESLLRGGTEITLPVINPITVMHNMVLTDIAVNNNMLYGNSILTYEFNYTPINSLGIYGILVQDQFETASEADRIGAEGTGEPNAYGYLLGLNYSLPINRNIHLFFNGEYAYTNPHLYRSIDSLNLYANTWTHHSVYNHTEGDQVIVEPLGYKYGPDARVIKFGVIGRFLNYRLTTSIDYIYLEKGEKTLLDRAETGAEAVALQTPSGEVDISHTIYTDINYKVTDDFSIYLKTKNLEFIVGLSYKL